MFYIYAHTHPTTNDIFYIGRGTGRRMYRSGGRTKQWDDYVKKAGGFKPVQLAAYSSRIEAMTHEKELIRKYLNDGIPLVNERISSNGSDASRGFVFTGKRHTEVAKEKCRLANLNKSLSDKTKQLISVAKSRVIKINDVVYPSHQEASKKLSIPIGSFSYLLKVNKPYQYKDMVIQEFSDRCM